MILSGGNGNADNAVVNHRNLDIKLVMVFIQPNRMAMMRQKKGTYSVIF